MITGTEESHYTVVLTMDLSFLAKAILRIINKESMQVMIAIKAPTGSEFKVASEIKTLSYIAGCGDLTDGVK